MKRQPSPVPLPCYFFNVQTCEYQVEDLADPCNVGEVFMREDVERLLAAAPQPQTEQAPPAAVAAGYAEMRDALALIEHGIVEGSIKCKPYIEFDPNATSLEPKSVLDLVRAAMLAAKKENGNG